MDEGSIISSQISREHDSLVTCVDIHAKSFADTGRGDPILEDLSFKVYEHEFIGILGPSGCGKTTLLRMIAGLDTDYEGTIDVGGKPVKGPGLDRGLVFQESRLLPWFRVGRNISFALPRKLSRRERRDRVTTAIDRVGLNGEARTWPHQLSGGMTRRVGLARAIANLPKLLMLDEPLSALDEPSRYALQDEITRIHSSEPTMTTIFVTHDIDEAVYLCDRVLILSQKPSHVIRDIPIPLKRSRDRSSEEFHAMCSSLTKVVFGAWSKASFEGGK